MATRYESEPNNVFSQATAYTDNDDMYGTMSSVTDQDWYRVKFALDGKVNFFLGYIPSGCNYNLTIWRASSQYSSPSVVARSVKPGSANELIENFTIDPNSYYYMQVTSVQGFNTSSRYQVRARNYPITDAYEPNETRQTAKSVANNATINATIHKLSDQDWYKFTSSGSLYNIKLDNLPYGTNYQLELYNNSGSFVGSSYKSGTTAEEISRTLDYGTYYVKVYSASGFNITSKYRLTLYPRSSTFSFNLILAPRLPDRCGGVVSTRALKNVPYKIYAVRGSDNYLYQCYSGQTSSSGYISPSLILPSGDYTKWRVEFTLNNTDIKVANNSGTAYTFFYDIPLPSSSNTISKTLPDTTALTAKEETAYGMWYNGYDGLTKYRANLGSLTKMEFRGDPTSSQGSETNGSVIWLNATSSDKDYLDRMVIYHELGHVWHKKNGMPSGVGGSHTWVDPSSDALSITEGFASYISTQLSGFDYMLDYGTSNTYGGNLRDRKYYSGYSASPTWSSIQPYPLNTTHSNNQKIELFAGTVMFNLRSSGLYSFATVRDSIKNKSSMKALYETMITSASSSNRVRVWDIFDKGGCAFDLTLPTINSLTRSGNTVTCSATDDVGVVRYDWYVSGTLRQSGTSNTFSVSALTGTSTIECRVFDPEGIATGSRPRTQRYASRTLAVTMSSMPVSTLNSFALDMNIQSDVNVSLAEQSQLSLNAMEQYRVQVGLNEDLVVYAHALGAVGGYRFINPDGTVWGEIDYIAPDSPYVIENAMPGEWTVTVHALDTNDVETLVRDNFDILEAEFVDNSTAEATMDAVEDIQTEPELEMPDNDNDIEQVEDDIGMTNPGDTIADLSVDLPVIMKMDPSINNTHKAEVDDPETAQDKTEQEDESSGDAMNPAKRATFDAVYQMVAEQLNTPYAIQLATRPSKVRIGDTINEVWTSDSNILQTLFSDDGIIIKNAETGMEVNKTFLPDGYHSLLAIRVNGLYEAEPSAFNIRINANAPIITFDYQDENMKLTGENYYETKSELVYTRGALSDGVVSAKVNGSDVMISTSGSIIVNEKMEIGENIFTIDLTDGVGNISTHTLIINRIQ